MHFCLALFLFIFSFQLSAAEFILHAGSEQFKFSEYDPDDNLLVREQGVLPTLQVSSRIHWQKLILQINYSYMSGYVDYVGQTQSGVEHHTQTAETIQDFSVFFHYPVSHSWSIRPATLYAGVGAHQWIRDIKTQSGVLGLYETYRWAYFAVGGQGSWLRSGRWDWRLDMQLLRTYAAQIAIDFKGRYANTTLDLGSHYGGRFALPVLYQWSKRWSLVAEPYIRFWELGRSPHSQLTNVEGTVAGGLHEPRGSGQGVGLNVGFVWLW